MRNELESPLNQMDYVIGVNQDYPARLREMLSAAAITYQLSNSSIDHVRRTYLKDLSYEEDPGGDKRLDRTIRQQCLGLVEAANLVLRQYPGPLGREPLLGEWIGDMTLSRVGYSIERAFAEADKGALYEAAAIARMAMEQCCWAHSVRALDSVDEIAGRPVGHCVTLAKKDFQSVGRLYGWMSRHAHWDRSAQFKAIASEGDYSAVRLASSRFKAVSYCLLIVLTHLYGQIVDDVLRPHRSRSLSAVREQWKAEFKKFRPSRWVRVISRRLHDSEDASELADILALQLAPRRKAL
jgi:hypothetical protein